MKKMLKEFKAFAIKGNAVDLAVGVVIGAAFGGVVNSLVKDIINPPLGLLLGGIDFSDKAVVLKTATETSEAILWSWGNFVTTVINFVIVAFAIFIVVKQMNRLYSKEEKKPTIKKSAEVELLAEIRDILKSK